MIRGLVLSGGRSTRMGRDKGALVYPRSGSASERALDQRGRGVELLATFCCSVHVSCRPEQAARLPAGMPRILDRGGDSGPAAGLLAASAFDPESDWLVFACDFPWAESADVGRLVGIWTPCSPAAYVHADGVLEPLFAIWTPRALALLRARAREGDPSPRRTLEQLPGCRRLPAPEGGALRNVNTAADFESAVRAAQFVSEFEAPAGV